MAMLPWHWYLRPNRSGSGSVRQVLVKLGPPPLSSSPSLLEPSVVPSFPDVVSTISGSRTCPSSPQAVEPPTSTMRARAAPERRQSEPCMVRQAANR